MRHDINRSVLAHRAGFRGYCGDVVLMMLTLTKHSKLLQSHKECRQAEQTNSFSNPKGEVSNLKASFKNRADKTFITTAMKSRQTAK
jgi:hypothetical protein